MHKNVEHLLGRLATDPKLRRCFAADPEGVLRELAEAGYELNEIELDALAATRPESLRSFAAALDARLQRAVVADDTQRNDDKPTEPQEISR
jgi:hypothetical protein